MKKTVKVTAAVLAVALGIALIPAGNADAAKVNVKKVAVTNTLTGSSKIVTVAKGKKVKLETTVTVKPDKAANKEVTYSSKNTGIATVTKKGVVKGIKAGKTKIVVTSKINVKKTASINVKVVEGAVTKVTLDKTSGSLNTGETLALKATVKAGKKADKTIAWSSSKESVATVDDKGVVTAVAAGSTVITALAADGSGKKAICKITVNDPVNISDLKVLNAQSVTFSLNRAYALTPDAVSVMKKINTDGEYRNKLVIESMSTTDSINYTIVLDANSLVYEGNYVQVSIPTLPGTVKTKELLYREPVCKYTSEVCATWTVNEYDSKKFTDEWGKGYSTISISGLPAGLVSESNNGELTVKGVPTTAGVTDATITAVDELGNTETTLVHFVIGSDTVIAGATTTIYDVNAGTAESYWKKVTVTGGSGNYKYSVAPNGDPFGLISNKDANGVIENVDSTGIPIIVKLPGNYSVTIQVSDVKDPSRTCNIVIPLNIVQGISVGGSVVDAAGNKISGASIRFVNKDKDNKYTSYIDATSNLDGVYSATLVAGNYDIKVSRGVGYATCAAATKYLYNQSLSVSGTGYDLKLPLYKVIIGEAKDATTGEVIDGKNLSWKANYEYVGEGEVLYLKPGTYSLESIKKVAATNINGEHVVRTYKYTATATVVNAAVILPVTRTLVSEVKDNNYHDYDD